jgi:hypothetical protein
MNDLNQLRAEANSAAQFRRHLLLWRGNIGACIYCGKEAVIDPMPPANGIDVGGAAVAVGCLETSEEYRAWAARLAAQHKEKFRAPPADVVAKFGPYFGRAWHVRVRFPCGTLKWGFISGTTGWQPALMVVHWNAHGSSWLLDERCEIIAKRRK